MCTSAARDLGRLAASATGPIRGGWRGAGPADTGAPTAWVAGGVITIRGSACQVVGGGIYAVDAPPPQGVRSRQVRYEARVGPLAPGAYGIVVGWFDPRTHLIEVRREPLHVKVRFSGKDERRTGSA
jgi:hypothetical protein